MANPALIKTASGIGILADDFIARKGPVIDVRAFGADTTGATDSTTAFRNAIAALNASGGTLFIPPGVFLITDTLQVTGDYCYIIGAGINQTTIKFNPSSGKQLWYFWKGTSVGSVGNRITSMRINAQAGNTFQKIAIDVADQSTMLIQDIFVDPTTSSNSWSGSNSIGIRLRGREALYINRVRMLADTPIRMEPCPNPPSTQSDDHVHISNTYLSSTPGGGNAIIYITDGTVLSNLTIDGDNGWLLDKYGIYWSDTSAPAAHNNIHINGLRMEQQVDVTGWGMYIDSTNQIQAVNIENAYFPLGNGIHLNGAVEAKISHSVFSASDGTKKHFETTTGTKDLRFENVLWQVGPTATLTGLTLMEGAPQITAASLPPSAHYTDNTTAGTTPWIHGGIQKFTGTSILVGAGTIIDPSTSGNLTLGGTNLQTLTIHTGGSDRWSFASGGSISPATDASVSIAQDNLRPTVIVAKDFRIAADAATGGATLKSSGAFNMRLFYWNGSASTSRDAQWSHVADNTTPVSHLQLAVAGTAQFIIGDNGILASRIGSTLASASTVAPTGMVTHITGTTTINTITVPTSVNQASFTPFVIFVFDGVAPWSAAGNIAVAGTPTTAGTAVLFVYDPATVKWYPIRLS